MVIAWALLLLTFAALIALVPSRTRTRSALFSCGISLVLTGAAVGAALWLGQTPANELRPASFAALFVGLSSIFIFVRVLVRKFFSWRSLVSLLTLIVNLAAGLLVANQSYNLYPDFDSFFPTSHYNQATAEQIPEPDQQPASVSLAEWNQLRTAGKLQSANLPAKGTRVSMPVPTPHSGFHARNAEVFLPPAWFTTPRPQLPVLTLMNGTPGGPTQWFEEGGLAKVVDHYQATHNGIAPIVVSIDATGDVAANPVCTDSPKGKVMTYLTQDVTDWIKQRFSPNPDQKTWTIGGFSYGGTCALQVVTNSPTRYGNFLDYSGELRPNDGYSHETTVKNFYEDSEALFQQRNPLDILNHAIDDKASTFHGISGRFVAGKSEKSAQQDLSTLNDKAIKAGMSTTYRMVPGGHDFGVWRRAIAEDFAYVAQRGGL